MPVVEMSLTLGEPHKFVLNDESRFLVLDAGRGFGKTQLILARMFKHLQKQYSDQFGNPLPHKIWYIAPIYKQGRRDFWPRLKAFFKGLTVSKSETDLTIRLVNGAEITIVGSEQFDTLRGPYLTLAIFDEAAFHAPNYWERVIRPMLGRVKPLGGGEFYSTPDGHNEFYQLFLRGDDPNQPEWSNYQFSSVEGGFIPESEVNAAKIGMTYEDWRQEYFGEFIAQASRVYRSFDRANNCKNVKHVKGLDIHWFWDFNEVPGSHSGLAHVHKDKVYVFDEICVGSPEDIVYEFFKRYPKEKLTDPKTGQKVKIFIYGDVSGSRELVGPSDYMRIEHLLVTNGYPKPEIRVTTVNPFEKDRINSVNVKLKNAAGENGTAVNPETCPKLVNDFEQVKRDEVGKIDKKTDRRLTHISDGFGYMVYVLFPVDSPSTKLLKAKAGRTAPGGYWLEAG